MTRPRIEHLAVVIALFLALDGDCRAQTLDPQIAELVDALAPSSELAASSSATEEDRLQVTPQTLEDAYLEILRRWSHGDLDAPLLLAKWQQPWRWQAGFSNVGTRRSVGGGFPNIPGYRSLPVLADDVSRCLGEIENRALDRLTAGNPSFGVSLALLYDRVFAVQMLSQSNREPLSQAAWHRLWRLIEGHPKVSKTDRQRLAQLVMTAGGYSRLLRFDRADGSRDLNTRRVELDLQIVLSRALDLDPESRAALYWLGFFAERYGKLTQAIDYFERLVELSPADREARLRLALTQLRAGRPSAAPLVALESVVTEAGRDWIGRIAWHQLALEQPARRQQLARQALEQYPADRHLLLLLAQSLEPGSSEQVEVIARVEQGWRRGAPTSTRQTYEYARNHDLQAIASDLAEVRSQLGPPLMAAIDSLPSADVDDIKACGGLDLSWRL